jgi:hypothetical protein
MANHTEEVDRFMKNLEHPLKEEIEVLRDIILNSDERITEHIKWNAPSFGYRGEDRVTFNLHPSGRIQLVFHRGAKVKDSKDFVFEDETGLLEWVASDRAVVMFHDMQDVEAKKPAFIKLVNQWMESTNST